MSNVKDEEEEEDYMSEAFLNSLVQQSDNDKSKKSNMTYSERRRQKHLEHLANLPKPLHVREKEAREKGLEKEIGEDNKGMAMLLKMGFKKGGTLGAAKLSSESEPQSSNGSTDEHSNALRAPIEVQIKQGRGGLGMDSVKKRQAEEELQRHVDEAHRVFDQDFRGKKMNQFEIEKRNRQLGAARAICMQLDAKKKTGTPEDQDQGNDTKDMGRSNEFWWISDSVPDEMLGTRLMGPGAEVITETQGDNINQRRFDLSEDGDNDESSKEKRIKLDPLESLGDDEEKAQEEEPPKWGEKPDFAQLEVNEKLNKVVNYLRDKHYYCFWCSAQYDGADDLKQNCPGEDEDDH
ncbi:G patch domain-containing protein 11 [Haplosporangium sp. Z 27]|nr:G patch domain-containing protein 11 [Haplosporangium sp. Z 27]